MKKFLSYQKKNHCQIRKKTLEGAIKRSNQEANKLTNKQINGKERGRHPPQVAEKRGVIKGVKMILTNLIELQSIPREVTFRRGDDRRRMEVGGAATRKRERSLKNRFIVFFSYNYFVAIL